MPLSTSANASRNANARARISQHALRISDPWCRLTVLAALAHKPASLASASENVRSMLSASPLRLTQHAATPPSHVSSIFSNRPEARTTPSRPSPYRVGLPLIMAIDCSAAIGVSPTSRPCMMMTQALAGVSTPLGVIPASMTARAMRHASSKFCGTIARTDPPVTSAGNLGCSLMLRPVFSQCACRVTQRQLWQRR